MRSLFKKIIAGVLRVEAAAALRVYRPHIVAVTGSVGKTSTKDAIFAMLAGSYHVRGSEKSFNSEFGLPLTILGLPNAWNNIFRWILNILDGAMLPHIGAHYPAWLVLEVGADRPGDISSLERWLPVDIAVITRLPEVPVHVEYFKSPEHVVEEKASLIKALKPHGTLVLFADDERTRALQSRTSGSVITFGFSEGASVRGEHFKILRAEDGTPMGMEGQLRVDGNAVRIEVPGTVGPHTFLPVLAAAAVGKALGKNLEEIAEALRAYAPPPGRMRLVRGIRGSTIIDDTYNSSPAAVQAAFETLALIEPKGRMIAVLGDMAELGKHSVGEHRAVGEQAAQVADLLVTVGYRARDIAEGALGAGMQDDAILQFENSEEAGAELARLVAKGDCVLIKGSQSMRMERAVEATMAEPGRMAELLVRQDSEWKKR
ncbi:MAG: UDP-N-acetylmuramoyl-tripeptide--D-alanyl-D-alanine ligase [Patescibacteria group bacterium]|nr:UDP-N-acetylmuramoyl-tripeptide--D-alanyl-D-alanine ligase [Patescibacteria group bacterium]